MLRSVSTFSGRCDISTRSVTSSSMRAPGTLVRRERVAQLRDVGVALRELVRRDVEREPQVSAGAQAAPPGADLRQRALERPLPERRIRPLSSATGMKRVGHQQAVAADAASAPAPRRRPAPAVAGAERTTGCQCSSSSPRASARRRSFSMPRRATARAFSSGEKKRKPLRPVVLGVVHRRVGVLQQLAEVAPVARVDADADRGGRR